MSWGAGGGVSQPESVINYSLVCPVSFLLMASKEKVSNGHQHS